MTNKNSLIIQKNTSLKRFNTFHLGGKAKYLIEVYSRLDLINAIKFCNSIGIKYKVIGFGSNLLFDDMGYNGAIIVNKSNSIRFYKNTCFADSGAALNVLIKKLMEKNLSGLENLVGIPSTIGGAVVNNTGAFGVEISDYIEYVECVEVCNLDKIIRLNKNECHFGYRYSIFKNNNYIITRVKFCFKQDEYLNIADRLNQCLYKKTSTQPLSARSAGSIFKRTPIAPASKLIDDLGLKGISIGGASVSTKHAGFIVTNNTAKSSDVLDLIIYIKKQVREKYSIELEEEVEYIK